MFSARLSPILNFDFYETYSYNRKRIYTLACSSEFQNAALVSVF